MIIDISFVVRHEFCGSYSFWSAKNLNWQQCFFGLEDYLNKNLSLFISVLPFTIKKRQKVPSSEMKDSIS